MSNEKVRPRGYCHHKVGEPAGKDQVMEDRERLLFEISFYESKIVYFRDMISKYEKEISAVKGELTSFDVVCSSSQTLGVISDDWMNREKDQHFR